LYSNPVDLVNENEFCFAPKSDPASDAFDFAALFGRATVSIQATLSIADYNRNLKIFDGKEWDNLFNDFKVLRKQNAPLAVYRRNFKVLANSAAAVEAYEANVLFVINSRIHNAPWISDDSVKANFFESFKRKSQKTVSTLLQPKGLGDDFPYIAVDYLKYDEELVKSMVNLSSWSLGKEEGSARAAVSEFFETALTPK
jgi:hypothetical protein